MMAKFGGVDKCPACQKSVYPMEKVLPACICIYVFVRSWICLPNFYSAHEKGKSALSAKNSDVFVCVLVFVFEHM